MTSLPWAGLVRKANHMSKIGRVGALPFQGSTFRKELCRFQQLAQATDAAASNFALTRRGNADPQPQAAGGRKPPSTQPKKAPQPRPHQRSRIYSYGDTLGPTVLNPPRPRDQAKGRAALGRLGGTPDRQPSVTHRII